jgi:hypothetical protein
LLSVVIVPALSMPKDGEIVLVLVNVVIVPAL